MGGGPKETLFQIGQQIQEKMLNVTNQQRNANQNHNELSPHTHQNTYHKNKTKQK